VAVQIVGFERAYEDFGGEKWEARFRELIASDPVLKKRYEARKNKKK
jgi:hypothetical protein